MKIKELKDNVQYFSLLNERYKDQSFLLKSRVVVGNDDLTDKIIV